MLKVHAYVTACMVSNRTDTCTSICHTHSNDLSCTMYILYVQKRRRKEERSKARHVHVCTSFLLSAAMRFCTRSIWQSVLADCSWNIWQRSSSKTRWLLVISSSTCSWCSARSMAGLFVPRERERERRGRERRVGGRGRKNKTESCTHNSRPYFLCRSS